MLFVQLDFFNKNFDAITLATFFFENLFIKYAIKFHYKEIKKYLFLHFGEIKKFYFS